MELACDWATRQWEGSDFGDYRLTQRATKIGRACLERPDKTLPCKMQGWSDLQAVYRFFGSNKVTHDKIQAVHRRNIRVEAEQTDAPILFIQDGSEALYNSHRFTTGLGSTCGAYGNGFLFHSTLAINWNDRSILGLAHQFTWVRPEDEARSKKMKKRSADENESRVWLESLQQIGSPPRGAKWISIGDRGSDNYEYYLCHAEETLEAFGEGNSLELFSSRCFLVYASAE